MSDGILFGSWLSDQFTLELVRDFVDPPLAFAVILSEGSSRAPDNVHRPKVDIQVRINTQFRANGTPNPAYGSYDQGIWQINSYWHNVGDAVALNPFRATEWSKMKSSNGTNFGIWIGYTSGGYLRHIARARSAWAALNT